MSSILLLGAAGSLGKHVAAEAVNANHEVSVIVRTPSKLPAQLRDRLTVHQADIALLSASQLAAHVRGHGAVISTAGLVSEGQRFVALVDHVATSLETLPEAERPVCWFLAGAGVLDIGDSHRLGVDLPVIKKTYWPHRENYNRLRASSLDWRLLCPGPMVAEPAVGIDRLRTSIDRLPVVVPAAVRWLPDGLLAAFFASRVPEMIIPYADAAAFMLNNLQPTNPMSRHRVGLALPPGMRGRKERWSARPPDGGVAVPVLEGDGLFTNSPSGEVREWLNRAVSNVSATNRRRSREVVGAQAPQSITSIGAFVFTGQ